MTEISRGLSYVVYRYDAGDALSFAVPFPYIERTHVRAYVAANDTDAKRQVSFGWDSPTSITIADQGAALHPPYLVTLQRVTPTAELLVQFKAGATLPARDLMKALSQLLYALQEATELGTASAGGIGGGGQSGGGYTDINEIVNQVVQSPAYQVLQQRIPEIDANAELIMEEILRSHEFFDTKRDYGDKLSTASERIELIEESDRTTAQQIIDLFARQDTADQSVQAQFSEVNRAIATNSEALVESTRELQAQIVQNGEAVSSALNQHIDTVQANAESARAETELRLGAQIASSSAQVREDLQVEVDAAEARISGVETTVASHGQSIAATAEALNVVASDAEASTTWRHSFAAQFDLTPDTPGDSVAAGVRQFINTKATPTEAQSIATTAVSAFANGTFAALQESYNSYVSANDGRWSSTWAIRVNGGDPANPVVGGIALGADTSGSTFVVQADRFAFTTPGATTGAGARFPFVIGRVGGVDTVGVTGQLLVDGSVSANKITVNTLSAITANAGTINGGTFKTLSLDANGNPINALEFRAEMSNIGDWPLWVGSGEKTENNAVFYLKKDGSAMFKGKVTAPNIVGQFQASTVVAWSGAVSICTYSGGGYYPKSDYTEIAQFTLGAPLLVGESHTPFVAVTVGMNKLTYGVDALLEQLVGGIWVPVVSHVAPSITVFATGSEGTSITNINPTETFRAQESSFSLIGVAQASTGTTTFRVRVKGATTYVNGISVSSNNISYNDGDRTVTSVSGSILGIR